MPTTKARKRKRLPEPQTPEWRAMHVQIAVMVEGRREECAKYLRQVADSIDRGCISGFTGDSHPCRGQYFSDR